MSKDQTERYIEICKEKYQIESVRVEFDQELMIFLTIVVSGSELKRIIDVDFDCDDEDKDRIILHIHNEITEINGYKMKYYDTSYIYNITNHCNPFFQGGDREFSGTYDYLIYD